MNHGKKIIALITAMLVVPVFAPSIYAEPLVYQGNQSADLGSAPPAAQGQFAATQVGYSTNYDTEFSPYSSFMQSPYTQAGVQMAYPQTQNPYMGQPYGAQPQPYYGQDGATGQQDPFAASEVSPYSKYSPYIEIIGEGSDYTLGIDDVVTVIVRNQPDFSGRFVVDPEGSIQYNFVGDIKADGLTKEELKAAIVQRLRDYVRYPEVAVMISQYRSKNIYVFGFVGRPGKYAMKGNQITVKEAIVAAGLPRADAALKRVYVIRPSEHREGDKAAEKKVNLKKLIQKGDSAEDFILKPGDTIVVHQKYFDRFVNAFSRLTRPLFEAAAVYELGFGGATGDNGYLNSD